MLCVPTPPSRSASRPSWWEDKLTMCTQGGEVEKWRKLFRVIFPGAENLPDPVVYENAYFTAIDPTLDSTLLQGGQGDAPQHDHPDL